MFLHTVKTSLLLLLLAAICLSSCARRPKPGHLSIYNDLYANKDKKPAPPVSAKSHQNIAGSLTPFQEVVVSLVADSLDLFNKKCSAKVFEVILKGIKVPDLDEAIEKSVLSSPRKEDIAYVAGLIVQNVYGKNMKEKPTIPQAIVYFYKDTIAYSDLTRAAAEVNSSEDRNLDAYNACLNLLVNSLASNYAMKQLPEDGLYVRDPKGDLYFHTKMKGSRQ